MGLIENIGAVFLYLLVGFLGFLLSTVVTCIIIVKSRMNKEEKEEE